MKNNPLLLKLRRKVWQYKRQRNFLADYRNRLMSPSYSQEGEDMILRRIFQGQDTGFYVDIGAHHPKRYSNTCIFYLQGWRGINIDPAPGTVHTFAASRPRDITLELAIAASRKPLTYFMFNEPALNGFSDELSRNRDGKRQFKIISQKQIETVTLAETLDRHLPANQRIDFLTVDVEGLDFDVLMSNDWSRYQPTIILAEDLAAVSGIPSGGTPLTQFLAERGYVVYAKTVNTLFFRLTSRPLPYEINAQLE